MYRINDKKEAIRQIQIYLGVINQGINVVPTGIYDDNTRRAVIDFQSQNKISADGVINLITFNMLYEMYSKKTKNINTRDILASFINFPLVKGVYSDEMIQINRILRRLLDYYGYKDGPSNSKFYSKSTADAVNILRKIYLLEDKEQIDEEFYNRMIIDHDSIFKFENKFE
jgi:peptidoglycan hydrolase-like protein with peptidoglycan-binding domain